MLFTFLVSSSLASSTVFPSWRDLNGDGYDDLVAGLPFEDNGVTTDSGGILVFLGASTGIAGAGSKFWDQNTTGIDDNVAASEYEGSAIATGDFNGDGYADVAMGVPGETSATGATGAGAVSIIYGSATGLTPTGDQYLDQDTAGMNNSCENGDSFGASLAAGDFDGDGYDDLAIGVPDEDGAGDVAVVYGGATGLDPAGSPANQLWSQDSAGVEGSSEGGDAFGHVLAAADFDGDGYFDLAIGVPNEDSNAGSVNVIYGSATGLDSAGDQIWNQDTTDVEGSVAADDGFGVALVVGDFDDDGYPDLAIGVPYEDVGSTSDAGSVNVLYGSSTGLDASGDQSWDQDVTGIVDSAEGDDWFGTALAAADVNGDGADDLIVGVPGEDVGAATLAGGIHVIYGGTSGLSTSSDVFYTQNTTSVENTSEAGDEFGAALAIGDFNADGYDDVIVGVPGEEVTALVDAGALHIFMGSATGLSVATDTVLDQDTRGVAGSNETGDALGTSLMR